MKIPEGPVQPTHQAIVNAAATAHNSSPRVTTAGWLSIVYRADGEILIDFSIQVQTSSTSPD
ncbi:MAG TPA: hypothetical protein VL793_01725, partial [Patescibacteria group bacterium]|nr:hypothetical protein [Patescibacteria group bacterium]